MRHYIIILACVISFLLSSCSLKKDPHALHVATAAVYPPFEYLEKGNLIGFDMDLMQLIGKELGKKVVFENMQFSSILPALSSKQVDLAISTITITPERMKQFAFSEPYYHEHMAWVLRVGQSTSALCHHKVAAQLGTTMAGWLKSNLPCAEVILMDNNAMAIEALKVGQVDAVLMDGSQAVRFSQSHEGLGYAPEGVAQDGYGIAFPKGSPLLQQVNAALAHLKAMGEIQKLKQKWLGAHDE